ncbi:hypothetical protein ACSDR0_12105 [Streptosporangium sp. G11]|uniref:hypothetical protein n=1 Tax=Streptosporangium sp. G11 TaxID=3436926 RepID=UPI003EBC3059
MAVTRPTGTGRRAGRLFVAVLALVLTTSPPALSFSPVGSQREPHAGGEDGRNAGGGRTPADGMRAGGERPRGRMKIGAAAPPTLSIDVDNGRTSAEKGDRLTYTVTVRNIGATDARGLRLTQSLPDGLRFVSADRGGRARAGEVTWAVDLKAGGNAAFHTTGEVRDTPPDLLRLATVACASAMKDDRPIVCATHSDLLPAGAAAEAKAKAARAPAPAVNRLWYAGAGAGLLVLVLTGVLTVRHTRRRASRHARPSRSL